MKAASIKKGLLKVTDETSLIQKKNDLETVVKLLLAQNLKQPEITVEKPVEKIVTSPQIKRKQRTELANGSSDEDEKLESNNRNFTKFLREQLAALAEEMVDFDMTVGHYTTSYPKEMNKLKKDLKVFVPIGKDFTQAWRAACKAIATERSVKKKHRN